MRDETLSKQVWKRFVQDGVMDSARLNKRISESWYRCRQSRVNPYSGVGREILSGELFEQQKERNKLLLELTTPYLQKLLPFVQDTGMIALVIDPEGYVLSMNGAKPVLENASQINFVEGVRWTETEVGTNAIGTSLRSGEPIMIIGTEHYSLASHNWSCSAAPIRDDTGKLLGILDISCPVERGHPQMLGMVACMAYNVEREWGRRKQQDELELLQLALEILDEDQTAVVCNNRRQVVAASKSIRQSHGRWSGLTLDELTELGYREHRHTPIHSRLHGGVIGSFAYLTKPAGHSPRISTSAHSSSQTFRFPGETGTSKTFRHLITELGRIARANSNVYIEGESGTGKELVARAIHDNSFRKDGPFVALNCGAVARELMESELFGYEEGAFTGARRGGYKGKLEQAHRGTLFLDEIGEIPPSMQVALLRVLQERKVTPIGGTREIPVDIRVISATHRDLRQLVKEGKFRQDLFYRLYVLPVSVPPLRERKEDIPHLVRYYTQKNKWEIEWPPSVLERLIDYDWPGNVRELFNVLERLSIVPVEEMAIRLHEMFAAELQPERPSLVPSFLPSIEPDFDRRAGCELSFREQLERQSIIQALLKTGGSASRAANLLGIPRSTFYRKLRKFGL